MSSSHIKGQAMNDALSEVGKVIERLTVCANDPMWADHAEIPKRLCAKAASLLQSLTDEVTRIKGPWLVATAIVVALKDHKRLTRELDVAMHGEDGAAEQVSLCDLIEPVKNLRNRAEAAEAEAEVLAEDVEIWKRLHHQILDRQITAEAEVEKLRGLMARRMHSDWRHRYIEEHPGSDVLTWEDSSEGVHTHWLDELDAALNQEERHE